MAKLSELQLASLLEEIACAMRAGTPVIDSMRRLANRRMGRVGRIAEAITEKLQRGESISGAITSISSPMISQVVSAIEAAERTGDSRLLSRMAQLLRRRANYFSSLRLAWFYPILLIVIAYGISVFVMVPLVREINGRDFSWPDWLVNLCEWISVYGWLPPIAMLAFCFLVATWLRRRPPLSRHARTSLFCHALADQLESQVPEPEAISNAATLSGDPGLSQIKDPNLESPAIATILSQAGTVFDIPSSDRQENLVARLRFLGAEYAEQSRRRTYAYSTLLPKAAIGIGGAGFMLAYVIFVLAPVYRQVAQW